MKKHKKKLLIVEAKNAKKVRKRQAKVLIDLKKDLFDVASKSEKLELRKGRLGSIPVEESQSVKTFLKSFL